MAAVAVVVIPGIACAGTVLLNNGDRISGRITQLTPKRVVVNTSYAGGIVIKLSKVATLKSRRPVKLMTGKNKVSEVTLTPAPGNVGWLTAPVAARAKPIPADLPPLPLSVPKAKPISWFGPDWENELDVGGTNTTGNSNSTSFNGAIRLHYKHRPDDLRIALDGGYGILNGVQSQGFFHTDVLWKRRLNEFKPPWAKKLYWFAQNANLYDAIQGISLRSNSEVGLGYYLWDNKRSEFDFRAGPGFTYERLFHGQTYSYINGSAALHFMYRIDSHLRFTQTAGYISSLQNAYNYQLDATSAIHLALPQIARGFGLRVSLTDLYDNTAGTQGLKRNSTLLIAALTFQF